MAVVLESLRLCLVSCLWVLESQGLNEEFKAYTEKLFYTLA
ncbi:hypothetical protein QL285_014657 [Trifolium repens]|nr:hypothetical protein QL285_014657 [Trifolium repens]